MRHAVKVYNSGGGSLATEAIYQRLFGKKEESSLYTTFLSNRVYLFR